MTCDLGLLLEQENTRGIKEMTFIDNIFYFRQLPQLSMFGRYDLKREEW